MLILVVIAIPSFRLIYYLDRTPDPDMTIKVTGHQWYWEYSYPDQRQRRLRSRYIHDEDLQARPASPARRRQSLVIPAGKNIRILTNSADVIHSFFIPAWACSAMRSPAARSRPGWRRTSPALITASATRSAARTTAGCRSPCGRCRRPIQGLGRAGEESRQRSVRLKRLGPEGAGRRTRSASRVSSAELVGWRADCLPRSRRISEGD